MASISATCAEVSGSVLHSGFALAWNADQRCSEASGVAKYMDGGRVVERVEHYVEG
jgi:hypothetical protein